MKKKIKFWICIFLTVYFTIFIIFTKYHAQNSKKDVKYDEIGLKLENSIDKNIANFRAIKTSTYNGKEIKNKFSSTLTGNVDAEKNINNFLSKSATSQKKLNEVLNKTDLTIKSISLNKNLKTIFYATPFTIISIKNDQYYPDEHVIIKKGKVGIHKYTEINKLVSEEIISKPQAQYQFLGTKSYERLPNFDSGVSTDYKEKLEEKKIKVKESIQNPQEEDKYKKAFVSYSNLEQLSHIKINDTLDIKVKWLSKKEYDKIMQEKYLKEQKIKEFNDAKDFTNYLISGLKYLDDNVKTAYFNKLNTLSDINEVNKLKNDAIKEDHDEASRNGIGTGKYLPPVQPAVMTAGVNWHLQNEGLYAVDFSPPGSYPGSHKITAADSGIVVQAAPNGPYGNCVIINHQNGFYTRYGHLNSFSVNVGDIVAPGDQLGWIGTTGNSTGTHVHFEIMKSKSGNTIDPRQFGIGY